MPVFIYLIATLLAVGFSYPSFAQRSVDAIDISALQEQPLRDPALFWATDQAMPIEQLPFESFKPLTAKALNRGITSDYHWIRVRLSNTAGTTDRHWILHHETPYLDELDVYYANSDESAHWVSLSDRVPFKDRPVPYQTLAFEHTTPAGGYTDLVLRLHFVKADALTLSFTLSDARLFHEKVQRDYLVLGTYYGLMISLLVIALIFAAILRQVTYLYYAVFLGFSILMWAQLNGLAFQYLWPDSPWWHNEGFHIIYLLTTMAALQFSRRFLKVAHYFPCTDRVIRASQWVMAGAILLRFAGVYGPVLWLSYLSLASLLSMAALGLVAYRRGLSYARWYCAAWSFYGLGLTVSVLSAGSNTFSWGMTPLIYAQAGGALEAVCLMVALGEKLLGWDRDRRLALKAANLDSLTGLGNRRALNEAFELLQASRHARPLPVFLILIDLDHFKLINDRYGHDAGDEVLRDFSRLLQRVFRPEDTCVRFGGEEFALLLQVPSQQHALDMAERIRTEFANTTTSYQGQAITHTLSAGVIEVKAQDGLTVSELIRQADEALYTSKSAGRNRTRFLRCPNHKRAASNSTSRNQQPVSPHQKDAKAP